jgi:hypothetical protein
MLNQNDTQETEAAPQLRATYFPEEGETPPARLFHSEHILGDSYSVCWREGDDAQARKELARLRIRPKTIEHRKLADWNEAKYLQSEVYTCLMGRDAHRKLRSADLLAMRCYLD